MSRLRRLVRRLLTLVCAVLFALVAAELGARAWLQWLASEQDFLDYATITQLRERLGEFERFRAHRHMGYTLAPGYRRGPNHHNSLGLRGDEITFEKPAGTRRIACCGGSTTYGEGVDDPQLSTPVLLEQRLRGDGRQVEVLNAGCPGWTTLETLVNFETRLLDLGVDDVVVCHGINDVLSRMVWPHSAYRGDHSGWLVRDEHVREASLVEASTLARIYLVGSGTIEPHGSLMRIIGDTTPSTQTFTFRAQRHAGTYPAGLFRDVPLERILTTNAPVYFERNLRSLLGIAKAHGVRVVLLTFPFSREFPREAYIGHPAVQAAIEETNRLVLRLGEETGTPVVDLAAHVVAKEMFTDGVHFTAAGNRERAERLWQFFKS